MRGLYCLRSRIKGGRGLEYILEGAKEADYVIIDIFLILWCIEPESCSAP